MDVSPYLMRRLRTLDEFLEDKGSSAALWRRELEQAGAGGKAERPRLTLVSSRGEAASTSRSGAA